MQKPKLALIPSAYKNRTVFSAIPLDGDGDFTFIRNSTATRCNKDGYIEEVTTDIPRLDWKDGNCPVLLLENTSTNELPHSDDFSNWTDSNITVGGSTISPSGEYTAEKITRDTTGVSNYLSKGFTKTASDEYDMTFSIFVKQNVGDFFAMRTQGVYPARVDVTFQFSTKTFVTNEEGEFEIYDQGYIEYRDGWYRLWFKFKTDFHSELISFVSPRSSQGRVDSSDTSSDSSVYVWGAQCEYEDLTSYIPTLEQSASRSQETCTDAGDATIFNDLEGVLYAEIQALSDDGTNRWISLSDGTTNNNIVIRLDTNNFILSRLFKNGNPVGNAIVDSTTDIKTNMKVAIVYNNINHSFFVNGNKIGTQNVDSSYSSGVLNKLSFDRADGLLDFYGKVKDLRYYDTALTDAELTELTS